MVVFREDSLELAGGRRAHVALVRADGGDDALVETIVEIDLASFVETTISRAVAEVLLHHGVVYLLKVDGDTVGSCLCLRDWGAPNDVVLASVGLLPGWRGRGLGQQLVMWTAEALAAGGADAVQLHVGSHNKRAIAMYKDAGFVVADEGARDPITGERALVLRKSLREDERPASGAR